MKYILIQINSARSLLSNTWIVTVFTLLFSAFLPIQVIASDVRCDSVLKETKSWFEPQADKTSPPYFDILVGELATPRMNYSKVQIDWGANLKAYDLEVPPDREVEFRTLSNQLQNATTYQEGIGILKTALQEAGLIQFYDRLVLRHASSLPPTTILNTGIYSANEAEARLGHTPSMIGQKSGDGVYTIGTIAAGWDEENTWGQYQYLIEYRNVYLMHNKSRVANSFMQLYLLLRKKFGQRLDDGFDGKMAVGMAFEIITGTKWAYEDFGIIGASLSLEVLLKVRVVPPENITYVGKRR